MSKVRNQQVATWTGCTIKQLPLMYLGAPISKGKNRSRLFDHIIQQIANKLDGWKAKMLSFAGKVTLMKSVLCSIPIHTISSVMVPKNIIGKMERLMKSFFVVATWCSKDALDSLE